MRRTIPLIALLFGATLLTPTGLANAVGVTCRGEAATIVGTGMSVEGTDGRDVIVSGSAMYVRSYAGNDLICLSNPTDPTTSLVVEAGAGDDVVDAGAFRGSGVPNIELGQGADQFFGSPGSDFVESGQRPTRSADVPDNERDTVDSGAGDDIIVSTGGTVANPDAITAGPGDDFVEVVGPLAAEGRLDGGEGRDTLRTVVERGVLTVDATDAVASLDNALLLGWSSFEDLALDLRARVELTYAGTPGNDSLFVSASDAAVEANLKSGNDKLVLWSAGSLDAADINAGAGRDTVEVAGGAPLRADLQAETLRWGGSASEFVGVENVSGFGSAVRLIGDDMRNVLIAGPCSARISGGNGRDLLSRDVVPEDAPEASCADRKSKDVFEGGRGNDKIDGSRNDDILRGDAGNDQIIGHQGHDTAFGGPGRDLCRAEIKKRCER